MSLPPIHAPRGALLYFECERRLTCIIAVIDFVRDMCPPPLFFSFAVAFLVLFFVTPPAFAGR